MKDNIHRLEVPEGNLRVQELQNNCLGRPVRHGMRTNTYYPIKPLISRHRVGVRLEERIPESTLAFPSPVAGIRPRWEK